MGQIYTSRLDASLQNTFPLLRFTGKSHLRSRRAYSRVKGSRDLTVYPRVSTVTVGGNRIKIRDNVENELTRNTVINPFYLYL